MVAKDAHRWEALGLFFIIGCCRQQSHCGPFSVYAAVHNSKKRVEGKGKHSQSTIVALGLTVVILTSSLSG